MQIHPVNAASDASDQTAHEDSSRLPSGASLSALGRAPSTIQGLRPSVVGMAKATLHKDLPSLAANYAMTIIDGAPCVNELARPAILASDLVLIPAQPSPPDIWASDDIVHLIKEAQIRANQTSPAEIDDIALVQSPRTDGNHAL